jgi:hypothetical protein
MFRSRYGASIVSFAEEGRAGDRRLANDGLSLNQVAQVTENSPWRIAVLVRFLKLCEVGCPCTQTGDEVIIMRCYFM